MPSPFFLRTIQSPRRGRFCRVRREEEEEEEEEEENGSEIDQKKNYRRRLRVDPEKRDAF